MINLNLCTLENVGKVKFKKQIDITDPCYDDDGKFRLKVKDFVKGNWNVIQYRQENYIAGLEIVAEGYEKEDQKYDILYDDICVDSGVCGFFDTKPNYDEDEWYDICFIVDDEDTTIVEKESAFKCNGVYTHSGYGDGRYAVYCKRNDKGEIYSLLLVFIDEFDDEDE